MEGVRRAGALGWIGVGNIVLDPDTEEECTGEDVRARI